MRRVRILLPLLLLLLSVASVSAQPGRLRGLDAYVTRAMADWEVPGLGLAIVRNDSIIYATGYGVRRLGQPERVDAGTVFAIGSVSKAFTALALAQQIDDGRASWDDPVTKHLPWFQMYDPYVTRELTLRDLLSHRSGLSRADRLWYGMAFSREEIARRVRYLPPTWSFRATYGYQNIMYIVAGLVTEQLAGGSWDVAVRDRIFAPLGMRYSVTSVKPLAGMPNVATPHVRIDDVVTPVAYRNIDNAGPAGSINSSVGEMAQWLRLQLARGTIDGRRVVSERNIREMFMPHMVIPIDTADERMFPETNFRSYGLGWLLEDYRGRRVIRHGGAIDGMSALVAMMPSENFGLVILTNMGGSGLPAALMRRIFDLQLGAPGRDWSAEILAHTRERQERAAARARAEEVRVADTRPSLPLERYAGTYRDALYGDVIIRHDGGALHIDAGYAFQGTLEHWHYDTFRAIWHDRVLDRAFITFSLNARGDPVRVMVEGLSEFTRVPAAAAAPGSGN